MAVKIEADSVDDGGSAFPETVTVDFDGREHIAYPGMSLRQWYAGQALAGICASGPDNEWTNGKIASESFGLADAMIAAGKAGA